jgi:hypothetical protein
MNKEFLLKTSILFNIIFFFLFFALLIWFQTSKNFSLKKEGFSTNFSSLQQIKKELHAKLAQKGLVISEPETINKISGKIKSLEEDIKNQSAKIILEIQEPLDPLNYLFPKDEIEVLIDSETEIVLLKPAPKEIVEKRMFEYNKAIQEGKTPPSFPPPWDEEKIKLKDLRIGDKISAVSKENIKFQSSFKAKKIEKKQTENLPF